MFSLLRMTVACIVLTAASGMFPDFLGDHKCPDQQQTCPDDAKCCPAGAGGGYMCCQLTSVPSSTCCSDGCCTDFETCCDGTCCIQQMTKCIKGGEGTYPSRCCPQWTVGCNTGSVGCCDPAQPWQWDIARTKVNPADVPPLSSKLTHPSRVPGAGQTVYALYITGIAGLESMTINASSGDILTKHKVTGVDDNPVGESTRDFLFHAGRKVFYYLDANFTADAGERPLAGRPIYLYTVDPTTGQGSKRVVSGATDFPTGYSMQGDNILMATEAWSADGSKQTGFSFYSLDPLKAIATHLSSVDRGNDESDGAFYAGFHRANSPDATETFRFGYKLVTSQQQQGLCRTDVSQTAGHATWVDDVSPHHDNYMSLDVYPNGTGFSFVSLAPTTDDRQRGLDLVKWSGDGSDMSVVAVLGNAHPPRVMKLGDLGYLATHVNGDQFVALVVSDSTPITDRWAVVLVDLKTGDFLLNNLNPLALAGTWGASGVGIA